VKKKEGILRIVKAPNSWNCDDCGGFIGAGEDCGKMGKKKFCLSCLKKMGGAG